jgi:hypothetical protein
MGDGWRPIGAGFQGNGNADSVDTDVGSGSGAHPLFDRRSAWNLRQRCDNTETVRHR